MHLACPGDGKQGQLEPERFLRAAVAVQWVDDEMNSGAAGNAFFVEPWNRTMADVAITKTVIAAEMKMCEVHSGCGQLVGEVARCCRRSCRQFPMEVLPDQGSHG